MYADAFSLDSVDILINVGLSMQKNSVKFMSAQNVKKKVSS